MERRGFLKKGGLALSALGLSNVVMANGQKQAPKAWENLKEIHEHPPVVEEYNADGRVRSGIALGGIGTGSVELRKDGNFYNWSIFNNYPFGAGPAFDLAAFPHADLEESLQFFVVRYQVEGEDPQIKLLQINNSIQEGGLEGVIYYYPWMSAVQNIEYAGRFPFVNMRYTDPEMPFDIEMKAHAPFIPHNIKDSSLPIVYFDFEIHSKIKKKVEVTLVATQRNLVAYDQVDKKFITKLVEDQGYVGFQQSVEGVKKDASAFGDMGLTIKGGKTSYFLGWEHRHPYYEELLISGTLRNVNDTENRNVKTPDGKTIGRVDGRVNDQRCFSSVAATHHIKAGGKAKAQVMMFWHFPNFYGAYKDDKKRGPNQPIIGRYESGLQLTENLGHYYQNFFRSTADIIAYGHQNKGRMQQASKHFQQGMYDTDIDPQILDQVNSHLNTFITSSTLTKSGKYTIQEGLTSSLSWGPKGTADVALYGSVMIVSLFPELQKAMMRVHRDLQQPSGEINHGIGYDPNKTHNGTWGVSHRVDLVPNYIQMVLRDYLFTHDKQYLKEMWPSVVKGIDYVLETLDTSGDGMPDMHGIMCSYDNFPMHGLASYLQSQWVNTMRLATIAAQDLGEKAKAKKYKKIAHKGRQLMDSKLWNGEYYRLANDYKGKKGTDEGCLTDQLMGQWVAHTVGLGHLFDQEKVRKALGTVMDYSFMNNHFLRNCTWPEHPKLYPIAESDLWVDQANTPWTGVELAFASFLIYEGMVEQGEQVIKAVDNRYRKAGLYWDHQEFGGHYFRPMSAWAILNAYASISLQKDVLTLGKDLPATNKKYFFTGANGGAHLQIKPKEGLHVSCHYGSLSLAGISLQEQELKQIHSISQNGKEIAWSLQKSNLNDRTECAFAKNIKLNAGDAITISFKQKQV
ncbi:GH116 family glycosyl hydrolase [Persicobacter diffluens]|uniref:Glucosylceramidase n=1 Tax=Persicobacter diffluens TaxID=981 RepID=A0AAN5ALU2_9BACT|nr:hypothetical protein PEDI_48970 [Persicobacter diffluens]